MQQRSKNSVADTAKIVLALKELYKSGPWPGNGSRVAPLYHGAHKRLFLTDIDLFVARERQEPPCVLQSLAIRERWFNKILHLCVKVENVTQVLILGSGFDTRSCKKNAANQHGKKHESAYAQVKFFEVDCDEILNAKEKIFAAHGIDKNAKYIRVDYTSPTFIEMLKKSGLNLQLQTLIIWEGNAMYHTITEVKKLLMTLQAAFNNVVISFDYFTGDFIQRSSSVFTLHRMGLWKSGLNAEDLIEIAKECGLTIVKTDRVADLEKDYCVNNTPPAESNEYICAILRK